MIMVHCQDSSYVQNRYSSAILQSITWFYSTWLMAFWGGSRGGSGGSVEPPKLNVKTYNKRVVKKKVISTKMEVTLEQLSHFKLPLKTLEIAFQRP